MLHPCHTKHKIFYLLFTNGRIQVYHVRCSTCCHVRQQRQELFFLNKQRHKCVKNVKTKRNIAAQWAIGKRYWHESYRSFILHWHDNLGKFNIDNLNRLHISNTVRIFSASMLFLWFFYYFLKIMYLSLCINIIVIMVTYWLLFFVVVSIVEML